jgi:hypothetical protein
MRSWVFSDLHIETEWSIQFSNNREYSLQFEQFPQHYTHTHTHNNAHYTTLVTHMHTNLSSPPPFRPPPPPPSLTSIHTQSRVVWGRRLKWSQGCGSNSAIILHQLSGDTWQLLRDTSRTIPGKTIVEGHFQDNSRKDNCWGTLLGQSRKEGPWGTG